jgi:hypothetical protein
MNSNMILWPLIVQISLTFWVFILLGIRKGKALKAGGVDRQKTALNNTAWPEDVVKVSNNIANQFQTPVLFYALCLAFMSINGVTQFVLGLASLYSLSRLIHAYVHVGSNYVPMRLRSFMIGILILMAMTITLIIQITGL